MRRPTLTILAAMLLLVSGSAFATGNEEITPTIGEFLQSDQGAYLEKLRCLSSADPAVLALGDDFNDFPAFDETIYSAEHRSIGRAFLYSFVVPGLGEYYVGSKYKAAFFFAVEVATWAQYMTNHSTGSDKEDEFRIYADKHWSPTKYIVHLIEDLQVDTDTSKDFSHHMPDTKTQQYYEMIGKYQQFWPGWDDYASKENSSERQRQYMRMRDDANNKLNTARTWAMVALANHVLSAFDAALSAKRFNKKRDVFSEVNVKARLADNFDERIPQIVMTYRFY